MTSNRPNRATACLTLALADILISYVAVADQPLRVATFNASLYADRPGAILDRLSRGDDPQAQAVAEIIQRVRPEILLINEIDYDPGGKVLDAFCENYLAVGQPASSSSDQSTGTASGTREPAEPINYPYRYAAPANTGVHSGLDLDRNGNVDATAGGRDYGSDCWGYGVYPGQYAFAILSQHPIDEEAVRTFRKFLWRDMPGALLPDDGATPAPDDWYSAEILAGFPLSSKNHVDVPIVVRGRRLHVLASHPTPPVFDGAEDRNGRRNHDEIRFWADYVGESGQRAVGSGQNQSGENRGDSYIYDDAGRRGGLAANSLLQPLASSLQPRPSFVILGDLNSDPHDGDGGGTIKQLLDAPGVLKLASPRSDGGAEAAGLQGGANARHRGDPAEDTCDTRDEPGPGNLRLDYVLPSADLRVVGSGVFWPAADDPLHTLVAGAERPASSDHRLVWIDLDW